MTKASIDCDICQKPIYADEPRTEWGRSPWGDGDGWAHLDCADDWEPTDEQMEAHRTAGYPTLQERQDAARKLK
jgi:hypothetical protein